jgi:hypothetical protein
VLSEAVAQATEIAGIGQGLIDGKLPLPHLAVSAGTSKLCFEIASDTLCADFDAIKSLTFWCFGLLVASSACFLVPSILDAGAAIYGRLTTANSLAPVRDRRAFVCCCVSPKIVVYLLHGTSCLLSIAACLISISILGSVVSMRALFRTAQKRLQGDLQQGPMSAYSRGLVVLTLVHTLVTLCTCVAARKLTRVEGPLPSSSAVGNESRGKSYD